MTRIPLVLAIASIIVTATYCQAAEKKSPAPCKPVCQAPCCPDDYCPKPYPSVYCGPQRVHCDDYCIKPDPCVANPYRKCADDYQCKPSPCMSWFWNSPWLKCAPAECSSCKK